MTVKEWLPQLLKSYYRETRYFDRNAWPESYLGRAREERGGFMQGATDRHYPEVRGPQGLLVRRAIEGMAYELRAVVEAHYASPHGVTSKERAKALGVSVPKYWTLLDCAYYYLAGRIERLDTQPVEQQEKTRFA